MTSHLLPREKHNVVPILLLALSAEVETCGMWVCFPHLTGDIAEAWSAPGGFLGSQYEQKPEFSPRLGCHSSSPALPHRSPRAACSRGVSPSHVASVTEILLSILFYLFKHENIIS